MVFSYFPFGFEGRMWDLIVSDPDHCLSFYFLDPESDDFDFDFNLSTSRTVLIFQPSCYPPLYFFLIFF